MRRAPCGAAAALRLHGPHEAGPCQPATHWGRYSSFLCRRAAGIEGGMRLVFSTSSSIRALQYIPVKEDLLIDLQRKTISLESAVGPVNFTIR